jgi:hypothetical protein
MGRVEKVGTEENQKGNNGATVKVDKKLLLHWWDAYGTRPYSLDEFAKLVNIIDKYGEERVMDFIINSYRTIGAVPEDVFKIIPEDIPVTISTIVSKTLSNAVSWYIRTAISKTNEAMQKHIGNGEEAVQKLFESLPKVSEMDSDEKMNYQKARDQLLNELSKTTEAHERKESFVIALLSKFN